MTGTGTYLSVINYQLTLVVLVLAVPIVLISKRVATVWQTLGSTIREQVGALNARLEASVSSVEVVKVHAAEPFERDRIADASGAFRDVRIEGARVTSIYEPANRVAMRIGLGGLLLIGGYWVLRGPPGPFTATMTAGALVPFVSYLQRMAWTAGDVPGVVRGYEQANAAAERVFGVQRADLSVEDPPDAAVLEDVKGAVAYEDVTYQYPATDEPAIENVSFAVEPDETVGIVGPTGAGKTTLLKLLPRFYDPDAGTVRIDSTDIAGVTRESLRSTIGYVAQEPFMFDGTVRENVTYGTPEADDASVRAAARAAGADAFVADLPEGYETEIGQRGVKLSGGQRQRLAIARALVRDLKLLLFDESTSHVDNETEAVIQARMGDVISDRTTFIVAHRLSTVRDADRILIVDDGALVEEGAHEELLDADGLYATLWGVQVGQATSVEDS